MSFEKSRLVLKSPSLCRVTLSPTYSVTAGSSITHCSKRDVRFFFFLDNKLAPHSFTSFADHFCFLHQAGRLKKLTLAHLKAWHMKCCALMQKVITTHHNTHTEKDPVIITIIKANTLSLYPDDLFLANDCIPGHTHRLWLAHSNCGESTS